MPSAAQKKLSGGTGKKLVEGQVRADTEHFMLLVLPVAEGTQEWMCPVPTQKWMCPVPCAHTGMDDGSAETLSHSFSLEAV